MTVRRDRRAGFTLLEVLLASAIAVMLLGGLYVAFDITLKQTDAGREETASNDLVRAVVSKMTNDLAGCYGPLPPKSGGYGSEDDTSSSGSGSTSSGSGSTSSGSGSGSTGSGSGSTAGTGSTTGSTAGAATGTTGTTGTTAGSTTGTDTSGTAGTTTSTTTEETTSSTLLPMAAGLIGSDKQFSVFASGVPKGLADPTAGADPTASLPADALKVTYFLGSAGGLYRLERPWVTADGVGDNGGPDDTEAAVLLAPEVVDFTVDYLDAGSWMGSWDGSELTVAGGLLGPPRAVRVTLVFQIPDSAGGSTERTVQHVIPLRAANGLYVPPDAAATTTTTGSGTGGM